MCQYAVKLVEMVLQRSIKMKDILNKFSDFVGEGTVLILMAVVSISFLWRCTMLQCTYTMFTEIAELTLAKQHLMRYK